MIRALFGGSFDPVHNGHVAIVDHLLVRGLADAVTVVPAWLSPHKDAAAAPAGHRLAMVRLAFPGRTGVTVDEREILRTGPSYTIDTLRGLADEHPGDSWRLVIGSDNLGAFDRWREAAALVALAEVVVMPRGGVAARAPASLPRERFLVADGFDDPVSSTAIRAMLAGGEVPDADLPPAVAHYIRAHGLYGSRS